MPGNLAVVAIGGNSLIKDNTRQTVADQHRAAAETAGHIVGLIKQGWNVVISHGNGPQVGFILRRSELSAHRLHEVPLEVCVADTQGAIGYQLQQSLYNHFKQLGIKKSAATIVTQVEIDPNDPAFLIPSKPIGRFMSKEDAQAREQQHGWHVAEDAGRGWRRVVPSPRPRRIVEEDIIRRLIDAGIVVIAGGGGGIPVIADADGNLTGIAAVIDKDHATALLAGDIGADLFLISTGVEKVAINFDKPNRQWLDHLTVAQAKAYLEEGLHFAKGSMAPKIQACIDFLERGGQRAIITNPENIERAVAGETGTHMSHQPPG